MKVILSRIFLWTIPLILICDYITNTSYYRLIFFFLFVIYTIFHKSAYCEIGLQNDAVYRLSVEDLNSGGLIIGGIGTGKTNLRYHLVNFLLNINKRVIDIDLKGELIQNTNLYKRGTKIVPGVNMKLNLFSIPLKNEQKLNYLFQLIINLTNKNPLSGAQKNLLFHSLKMTIDQKGNIQDFFENIIFVSLLMQPSEIQEKVSHALITRLNFLKQDLGSIFWTDNKKNDLFDIKGSLFFDLSHLNSFVTSDHLKILVNLILEIIILSDTFQTKNYDSYIFIEEAQLLTKNEYGEITKLEEIISSLRYRGYFVFLIGTRVSKISEFAFDNGLVFLFRHRQERDIFKISNFNMPNFNCRIYRPSDSKSNIVKIFNYQTLSNKISINNIHHKIIEPFYYTPVQIRKSVINAVFREFKHINNILDNEGISPNKIQKHFENLEELIQYIQEFLIDETFQANIDDYTESMFLQIIHQLLLFNHHLFSSLSYQSLIVKINYILNTIFSKLKYIMSEYIVKDIDFFTPQHS